MIKARTFPIVLLSILFPLLAVLAACSGDAEPATPPVFPTVPPVEEPRPLTASEREAMDEFVAALQDIQEERDTFYQDFESWRAGLTECHPTMAREAMNGFAASFTGISERTSNLPRASITSELADLLITAAEAEAAALRQLRDRWQAGNISLFEQVELRRGDSVRAQKNVEDLSMALSEEFEEGATESEVEDMKNFADVFDEITDDWDDYNGAYLDLRQSEAMLTQDELREEYLRLIEQFEAIVATVSGLTPPLGNEDIEDIIETLHDLATTELAALKGMADSLSPAVLPVVPSTPVPALPAPTSPPEEVRDTGGAPVAPGAVNGATGESAPSPLEELEAAVEGSMESLEDIGRTIEETVEDKSAEYLADVETFNTEYRSLVREWDAFHREFNDWRENNGGCDQVAAAGDLEQFSQRASALGRQVRNLPRAGILLPIYSLVVDAAGRDEAAMRTLYNSWRPFAVDAFRAVDEERTAAGRLLLQASFALEELRARP